MSQTSSEFIPLHIAILTVSSRRGEDDDTSGHYLREAATDAGHQVVAKAIVKENRYAIRAQVSQWIAEDEVQVVLINGGTGFTDGDQAPEALLPLFDREIEGFGEVFRMLSFEEIGTSTLQCQVPRKRAIPRGKISSSLNWMLACALVISIHISRNKLCRN